MTNVFRIFLAVLLFVGTNAFVAAQAGGESGQQENAPNIKKKQKGGTDATLSGRTAAALCECTAIHDLLRLSQIIEDENISDEKKMEYLGEIVEVAQKVEACIQPFVEESEKLNEDEKATFETELQEKLQKNCPDIANALKDK